MTAPYATAPVTINLPLNQPGSVIQTALNSHATRLDSDENNISTLQSQMTTANSNITANTNAITALQGRMSTAETNITSNTNAIASINSQLTTINNTLTSLQNQINAINSQITTINNNISSLQSRMGTAETNINSLTSHNSTQDQLISDLDSRVTALENGGAAPTSGPFIGDMVHLRDEYGHCQPAIVYEDWDGKNNTNISVVVIKPLRLMKSDWQSEIECIEYETGQVYIPYSQWHWPEATFTYRANLLKRVRNGVTP